MNAKLSKDWITHSPDFARCLQAGILQIDKGCECGIEEKHTHCKGCGRVISIGPGTVIAEYKL